MNGARPEVALLAVAGGLVPVAVMIAMVALANGGFFGGFALGITLVLVVMIVVLGRRGLRAASRST